MKSSIALLGLRGSGKSTLGRKLADHLNWTFLDMDDLIVEERGESIREWVAKEGWDGFRMAELNLLNKLKNEKKTILATGGGAILKTESQDILKNHFFSIYLHAEAELLAKRTSGDKERPALTSKSHELEVSELYEQRDHLYRRASQLCINSKAEDSIENTLEIIVNKLTSARPI